MANEVRQGTVKIVFPDKGYGFLTPDGSQNDLFFHFSALVGVRLEDLVGSKDGEGSRVEFQDGVGPKGPNATNVKLLGSNEESNDEQEAA